MTKEEKAKYKREWRKKNPRSKEYDSNAAALYRLRHPEKIKAMRAAYKETAKVKGKEWAEKNKDKRTNSALMQKHGITLEEYKILLEKQNNKCAICPTEHTEKKKLHVDHNHKTGRIRELLCGPCNSGLGQFFDNPNFLREGALYIERHNNE